MVWLYMSDDPLPEAIDHVNRDGTDNRWRNLRGTTIALNSLNRSIPSNNTSGYTGVYWHGGANKWMASYRLNRKQCFIGMYDDPREAQKAVLQHRIERGFDPGHGSEKATYVK